MTIIIVGGGAAGAAAAARLSEDPDTHVVLLEAGTADGKYPAELLDASTLRGAMPGHPANWSYPAHLTPEREYMISRGKILGGSSTINGGYFIRVRDAELAEWARIGDERWAPQNVLPTWRAIETDADFAESVLHGSQGPVPVRRNIGSPMSQAFVAAAVARGHAEEPDKNGGQPAGVGAVPSNIVEGTRFNMALAYLEPVRGRPNLQIRGDTSVSRIIFRGTRAVGVETSRGKLLGDSVILCAGAIGSTRILLSSGVGPRQTLEPLGITVVADLPVGRGFIDHPEVTVSWRTEQPTIDASERYTFPTVLHLDSSDSAARFPDGDIELLLSVKPITHLLTGSASAEDEHVLPLFVGLQAPTGRGSISLRSADPAAPLRIDYRYLENEDDRSRIRIGVREAIAILQSDAFGGMYSGLTTDLRPDIDDADLDHWVRMHLGTAIHMSGTAPMGSVVDGAGRVLGVDGLRVADTSIIPVAPSRGPFAAAVLIGEIVARAVREGK